MSVAIQVGGPKEDVAVAVIAVLKAIADNRVDREVGIRALDVVASSCTSHFSNCNFEVNQAPSEGDE